MYLDIEKVKSESLYVENEKYDFSDREIDEVLLKKVNYADVSVSAYAIENDEIHLTLDIDYNIDYLDAFDLHQLNLDFQINTSTIFTSNVQKSEEFDLDLFTDEIDIKELVWNLVLVDVPLNYSEHSSKFKKIEEVNVESKDNTPFADLFKK